MAELTVVIPTYNEAANVRKNIETLRRQLADDAVDAVIVLVDDGSRGEDSWSALRELARDYSDISCIRLSRNFGKETAVFAGLAEVRTPLCLVMDSDLQHPPRYIRPMLERMKESGVDLIDGVKSSRGNEGLIYKLMARTFYWAFEAICGVDMNRSSDFKLFNRKVLDALMRFKEGTFFFRGLTFWVGFRREEFPFDVDDREEGGSRFSGWRLARFAVHSILTHSGKPLYLVFIFALVFIVLALVMGASALYHYWAGTAIGGFTTVILLLSLFGGITLFSLGIIGLYLSRIYEEVKGRPQYLISERAGASRMDS